MIDVKIIKKPKGNGTTIGGGIATNGNDYASGGVVKEAMHAARADMALYANNAGKANEANEAIHAQESDHAKKAFDLDEDSPIRDEFLSKIADDVAAGHITFLQGLKAVGLALFEDGAHFGQFVKSLFAGKGAGIDKDGNAEVESLRVRSYMEVMELIINRLSALEGDQLLTESDTVESVLPNADGTYDLFLKSKWEGYFTAQAEHNVLKGIINTLAQGSGDYYTSWMRVNSVNPVLNMINVSVYPDAETPAGQNFPPREMMKIARWGNQTDPKRQSCLYLSSSEGRIVKLTGVTKPIIDEYNYGATFGSLPEFLYDEGLPLMPDMDYLFARGIVVSDLIYRDKQGRPIATEVDRGQWDPAAGYYCEERNPDTGVYETSSVWHIGCKYKCMRSNTGSEPSFGNTDWVMIEGDPRFLVAFAPVPTTFRLHAVDLTLTVKAMLHNQDVTAQIRDADVVWTRYSEDADGNPRPTSDALWAAAHASAGKSCHITSADIDYNGRLPKVIAFTATVTLRDGAEPFATKPAHMTIYNA